MPTPPYAKLLASRNGGAPTSGGIIAAFGDVIQLSSEDVSHPDAFKYEIYEYPNGFSCPAGWSVGADGRTYYYASGATPPPFTLPSSHGTWGDFLFRHTINNGDPGPNDLPREQFIDEGTAVRLVSDSGLTDTAFGVGAQFNALGAIGDLKANLRIIDVGLGSGFGTGSIADHAVTLPKLLPINTASVLGRASASTGNVEVLSVTGGLETAAGVLRRSALTGDVTAAAGSSSTTIAPNVVDFSKEAQIGVGLVGNDAGTANQKLITLGASFGFTGGSLILAAAGVALSMLATIAAGTFLGNITGSSAAPVALTATQVTANLNAATTTLKGLVPAPGTATGKVLKDDLTWGTITGTFTSPGNPGDNGKLSYASAGANAWTANITTDATSFFFGSSPATGALLGVVKTATVLSGLLNASGQDTLIRWGIVAADELTFGGSTGVAAIRSRVKTAGSHSWEVNGTQVASMSSTGATHTSIAASGTVAPVLLVTDAAHTALTASTERNSVLFNLNQTRQWATGALTSQRSLRMLAPTIAFVGASTVGTAATMAISGAPAAGTNATLTQSLALWIEAGAIGFGSSAALSGLTRFASGSLVMTGRSSTSTDVNLIRWGTTATDELAIGDDTTASLLVSAATTLSIRLGGATKLALSTTQLDLKNNNIVNLTAVNGTYVTLGIRATLSDADATLTVGTARVYQQVADNTAIRVITLSDSGAVDGDAISISRHVSDGLSLQVNNHLSEPLYTFPAGKGVCDFFFAASDGKFHRGQHMPIS